MTIHICSLEKIYSKFSRFFGQLNLLLLNSLMIYFAWEFFFFQPFYSLSRTHAALFIWCSTSRNQASPSYRNTKQEKQKVISVLSYFFLLLFLLCHGPQEELFLPTLLLPVSKSLLPFGTVFPFEPPVSLPGTHTSVPFCSSMPYLILQHQSSSTPVLFLHKNSSV